MTLCLAKKAQEIADANDQPDEDWCYEVEIFPNGRAIIKVYDEDGIHIGHI